MLCRHIIGNKKRPTRGGTYAEDAFAERFEVSDTINHQIIDWFSNTLIPSTGILID